ncbi:hypothetical protein ZOSMA_462G00100 [Zostera marina]|uniref:Uncharacterized protein n=1 Tax=Zostera marina TaxID=29655 RepID=A0A0K9P2G7_ZOSMR|nr:hypothetical protein ZOSMA_462G00100 [Zostera marina]
MHSTQNPTLGRIVGPSLHKIIKTVVWRKHADLVDVCKSALDKLEFMTESLDPSTTSSMYGLTSENAREVITPPILAMESGIPKAIEPTLECAHSSSLSRHSPRRDRKGN